MINFSLHSKKPILGLFSVHFLNFWGKKSFFQKLWLCHAQLHNGFLHHVKIQRKLKIQLQGNTRTDSRMEHTLFYRILPATAGGLASTTAVDWHLKVKDMDNNIRLTKNYCITVSMQKINSIHTLILEIQQV